MNTNFRAVVDRENNAEEFWPAFREAIETLDHNSELAGNCRQLDQRGEVELLDGDALSELQDFLCDLPGFSDGPDHAQDAVLFYAD